MAPVARAVWQQEAREGDLRFAHLRLREYAAEAAQYGAGAAEGRQLAAALGAAVANQVGQGPVWHWRRCVTPGVATGIRKAREVAWEGDPVWAVWVSKTAELPVCIEFRQRHLQASGKQ
jgi:hypothetical protein